MNKRVTSSALAALMIAGTTSFTAFAQINPGTAVIGNKAYDLNYLATKATKAEQKEVLDAIVAGEPIYVKDFAGNWIDNLTGEKVDASVIPAVTYKDADGNVSEHSAGDDAEGINASVKSVKALSLKQFKITFTNPVNDGDLEDDIKDVGNYTLENEDGDEIDDAFEKIEIDDSKKFAIMTLNDDAIDDDDDDKVQNQKSYKLTIDDNVFGKEIVEKFDIEDLELPEAVSAEIVGKDTIKVRFSEPVRPSKNLKAQLSDECFEINDDDIAIDQVNLIDNGNEANIILCSDLKNGQDVKVKVLSKFEDYAGYSIKKRTFDLKVEKNTDDLKIVGYKDTSDTEITLIFNKDIKFGDDNPNSDSDYVVDGDADYIDIDDEDNFLSNFYHTNTKTTAKKAVIDGNELTLTFDSDDALPDGTAYVYVDADALQDLWDKSNDELMVKATINADKVKPEVKKVEQGDTDDTVTVKFTEKVKDSGKGSAEKKENYTLYNKDGDKVKITKVELNSDKNEATLTLKDDLDSGKEYKLVIEDVEDTAGNKMAKATVKFKAEEKSAVEGDDITVDVYSKGTRDQKLVVDFDGTEMETGKGKYAIDNIGNYTVQVYDKKDKEVVKQFNLEDYYKAKLKLLDDNNGVELDLPGDKADKEDQIDFSKLNSDEEIRLVIARVKTASGNMIDNVAYEPIVVEEGSKIDVDDAPVATAPTTIKVSFEKEFDLKANDLKLVLIDEDGNPLKDAKGDYVTLRTSSIVKHKEDGVTKVTYTLDKKYNKNTDRNYELNFDGTYTYRGKDYKVAILVVDNKTENEYDSTFEKGDMWIVSDHIKPAFAKFADDDGDTMADNRDSYEDRDDYDDYVNVVAFTNDKANKIYRATIELRFEEALNEDMLDKYTFKLSDSDIKVTDVRVDEDNPKIIYLDVDFSDWDPDGTESAADVFDEVSVETRNYIEDCAMDYSDGLDKAEYDRNETNSLSAELNEDRFAHPMPEFKVPVKNHAPQVKNEIADQTEKVGAEVKTIEVKDYFADADGDVLTFTATSDKTDVAKVELNNGVLTITPVAEGTAEITVTAKDGSGAEASDTFKVTVEKESVVITELVNPADIKGKKADIKLPATVKAKYSDGTEKDLAVAWNKKVDDLDEGENTLIGTVDGTDKTATLKVIVEKESTPAEGPDFIDESESKVKVLFAGIAVANIHADEGCKVTVNGAALKYDKDKKVYTGSITNVKAGDKVTVTAEKDGKSSSETLVVEEL
ncbi:outer cell wall protein precursor [Clostridium tepidiprofundi DSM 19306]|uniref:Outer cell wall protein n=1 Tax=Clostridium tepidiprofundi DSM 19306 TaxID=1121338 RepID=A0A151B3H4_9CLOT|nr:Ig-like domain-containing protein [Clostridium tepidiprofundi]KYH34446.1 outer cell wall protein precursor [Clostridium tepidiprofundi DSM 19306]